MGKASGRKKYKTNTYGGPPIWFDEMTTWSHKQYNEAMRIMSEKENEQIQDLGTIDEGPKDKVLVIGHGKAEENIADDQWAIEKAEWILAGETTEDQSDRMMQLAREVNGDKDVLLRVSKAMFLRLGGRVPDPEEASRMVQLTMHMIARAQGQYKEQPRPVHLDPVFNGSIRINPRDAFITVGHVPETGKWKPVVMKVSPGSETGYDLIVEFSDEFDSADQAMQEAGKMMKATAIMRVKDDKTTFEWPYLDLKREAKEIRRLERFRKSKGQKNES